MNLSQIVSILQTETLSKGIGKLTSFVKAMTTSNKFGSQFSEVPLILQDSIPNDAACADMLQRQMPKPTKLSFNKSEGKKVLEKLILF